MSAPAELEERIDALEMHVAHQEATLGDLEQMVTRQWTEIDRLRRLVEQLTDRIAQAEDPAGQGGAPEPPPPHY